MIRLIPRFNLLALCVFASTLTAFGQSGAIQGTLNDPQGSVIAGAKVALIDEAKGLVVRETTTDKSGAFQLLPLQRGTYTLKVEAQGFKTIERKGLVLDPYQILNLGGIKMEVGGLENIVTVTAEPRWSRRRPRRSRSSSLRSR